MTRKQQPKSRKSLIFRVCLLAFVIYAVVILVDMQVNVADRRQELLELENRLQVQVTANKEIQLRLERDMNNEEIERLARERLDYIEPNERVFIDISGS